MEKSKSKCKFLIKNEIRKKNGVCYDGCRKSRRHLEDDICQPDSEFCKKVRQDKKELEYIHTRLQTDSATVFLAINQVENVLELQTPLIILDNELAELEINRDTRLEIDFSEFNVLKKFFESLHGEKLPRINIENLKVCSCMPVLGLENEVAFVTIDECLVKRVVKCYITLTDKITERNHSIEISREVYDILKKYSK